jgi:hypothetical protein
VTLRFQEMVTPRVWSVTASERCACDAEQNLDFVILVFDVLATLSKIWIL